MKKESKQEPIHDPKREPQQEPKQVAKQEHNMKDFYLLTNLKNILYNRRGFTTLVK
jgi:hypothetical protein